MKDSLQSLIEQAQSTFWGHLGCKLEELTEEHAIISLELGQQHKNMMGIVHGGVMMSMLDNAMGLVVMFAEKGNTVTASMNTHFLANVASGNIMCKAELLHRTKRTITLTAQILDEQNNMLAWASGAYRLVK